MNWLLADLTIAVLFSRLPDDLERDLAGAGMRIRTDPKTETVTVKVVDQVVFTHLKANDLAGDEAADRFWPGIAPAVDMLLVRGHSCAEPLAEYINAKAWQDA